MQTLDAGGDQGGDAEYTDLRKVAMAWLRGADFGALKRIRAEHNAKTAAPS